MNLTSRCQFRLHPGRRERTRTLLVPAIPEAGDTSSKRHRVIDVGMGEHLYRLPSIIPYNVTELVAQVDSRKAGDCFQPGQFKVVNIIHKSDASALQIIIYVTCRNDQ